MTERLLAQRLIRVLRSTAGRNSRIAFVLLEWAREERDWLWPQIEWPEMAGGGALFAGWDTVPAQEAPEDGVSWDRLPALAEAIDTAGPDPALFGCLDAVSELLGFDPFERELLRVVGALDRLPRLAAFRSRMFGSGEDLVALAGRLAGAEAADAARRVRRSGPVRYGLLFTGSDSHGGGQDLGIDWRFARVIDAGLTDPERLTDALAGVRQDAALGPDDFAEQAEAFGLVARLLGGALRQRAEGVNVLIYGPPGTGKTELARTVAAAVQAPLYAVGEVDHEGEEPSRQDRLAALRRAQRLLARRGGSLLLFDEMEDLFADASLFAGSAGHRTSSKIFVNRLLEGNQVPTIWTSNAIDEVDPAHLRRMSFILKMGYPSARTRARIVGRLAEAEGAAAASAGLERLIPVDRESAGVARSALRAAMLAGGGAADAEAVGRSLLGGLRGGREPAPAPCGAAVDLDLYEADVPIAALVDGIVTPGAPADVSLLLTGPPGTGKTALAALVAERLDRPLVVKRASDLLSAFVGGTEANIAAAFAEARESGSVLLFDEADSLLLDRAEAQRSWELSQVNELLTWMDRHPLPFIAATNYPQRLDPAALRRFVFKIALQPLSAERMALAWARYFGGSAPADLAALQGLTPGDFAVVARQLRFRSEARQAVVLALLESEARAKPERYGRIGF